MTDLSQNLIDVSFILTTMNRSIILKENILNIISKLKKFTFQWEIIVAIDCKDSQISGDDFYFDERIKIVYSKISGASNTRNIAIKNCSGRILFFLQDDVFPQGDCIQRHLEFHRKFPELFFVFQGIVVYPANEKNNFMDWLEIGLQNNFKTFSTGFLSEKLRWEAANSSVKKDFIIKNHMFFKEDYFVFENLDLEIQMKKNGARIYFDSEAISYHHHIINNPEEYRNRMIAIANFEFNYWNFYVKDNPDLKKYVAQPNPKIIRTLIKLLFYLFSFAAHILNLKVILHIFWNLKMEMFKVIALENIERKNNEFKSK